jgi:hypothetical protein
MKKKPENSSDKPNWLLFKENDEWAQPEDAPAITDSKHASSALKVLFRNWHLQNTPQAAVTAGSK